MFNPIEKIRIYRAKKKMEKYIRIYENYNRLLRFDIIDYEEHTIVTGILKDKMRDLMKMDELMKSYREYMESL